MVSIKLKFRASSKAGKEGSLYYQVIYNRMVRQISTPHKIFTEEWNPDIEDLIIKPPSSRLNYLESINRMIRCDMKRIHRIVRQWVDDDKVFTIDEIVETFHNQSSGNTLFAYMERIISHSWRQGQYREPGLLCHALACQCQGSRSGGGRDLEGKRCIGRHP